MAKVTIIFEDTKNQDGEDAIDFTVGFDPPVEESPDLQVEDLTEAQQHGVLAVWYITSQLLEFPEDQQPVIQQND